MKDYQGLFSFAHGDGHGQSVHYVRLPGAASPVATVRRYTAPMSDIIIVRQHSLGISRLRVAVERVAAELQADHDLIYVWRERNLLALERPGVAAEVRLSRREVLLRVRLGLFYLPFRGALEREIHEYFDRAFAS